MVEQMFIADVRCTLNQGNYKKKPTYPNRVLLRKSNKPSNPKPSTFLNLEKPTNSQPSTF